MLNLWKHLMTPYKSKFNAEEQTGIWPVADLLSERTVSSLCLKSRELSVILFGLGSQLPCQIANQSNILRYATLIENGKLSIFLYLLSGVRQILVMLTHFWLFTLPESTCIPFRVLKRVKVETVLVWAISSDPDKGTSTTVSVQFTLSIMVVP